MGLRHDPFSKENAIPKRQLEELSYSEPVLNKFSAEIHAKSASLSPMAYTVWGVQLSHRLSCSSLVKALPGSL